MKSVDINKVTKEHLNLIRKAEPIVFMAVDREGFITSHTLVEMLERLEGAMDRFASKIDEALKELDI